mmetsp:Transcript_57406/g.134410  ORF Transcript_57406/g.134410 Transcript_57406/m.134410 type:complete len:279 (-) Transcript_57406:57-893(-)
MFCELFERVPLRRRHEPGSQGREAEQVKGTGQQQLLEPTDPFNGVGQHQAQGTAYHAIDQKGRHRWQHRLQGGIRAKEAVHRFEDRLVHRRIHLGAGLQRLGDVRQDVLEGLVGSSLDARIFIDFRRLSFEKVPQGRIPKLLLHLLVLDLPCRKLRSQGRNLLLLSRCLFSQFLRPHSLQLGSARRAARLLLRNFRSKAGNDLLLFRDLARQLRNLLCLRLSIASVCFDLLAQGTLFVVQPRHFLLQLLRGILLLFLLVLQRAPLMPQLRCHRIQQEP